MKRILLFATTALLLCFHAKAQQQLAFPFQGGKGVMMNFFKDSFEVSPQIIQKRASGTAIFKFTADANGAITKIIIYYADDLVLVQPAIDVLKKSNTKWIIPDNEKVHDFIIPFTINFIPPPEANDALQKAVYDFYTHRSPVLTNNQVPLDMATLLPAIVVNY